ncbi:HNH endonuclease [Paeniglutamicibacter sp. R2-26]|uniref:HNH endonuclease n=1 Tax=Paeniglutamicibacter sp. R2-26 TaxID=3144417 RepID=UPI003EE81AE2
MSWLKQSDAAANHPITLRVLEMEEADDRILNEAYGWVNRCATQAAAHDKDYIVEIGTARAMAGSFARFTALREAALFAGYFIEVMVEIDGEVRKAFKLVEEKDLFHMILKSEKEWTAQRQADNRNLDKTGPVRLRDGDACRYCGRVVTWSGDRKSVRWGSIDHVVPGEEGTIETMVVCCGSCNSSRKNDPDSVWKTLPAPTEPLIGPATARFLTEKCGIPTEPTYLRTPTTPVPPAPANGTQVIEEPTAVEPHLVGAPAKDDAPVAVSDASIGSITGTPGSTVEGPEATAIPASRSTEKSKPDHRSIKVEQSGRSGYAGSGRDGTGWVGTGGDGAGHDGSRPPVPRDQPTPKRRRRSRPRNRKGTP